VIRNLSIRRGIQIYLGIFLISNAGVGWMIPLQELGLPADAGAFITKLWQINFIMPAVKAIELVSGVLFLWNRKTFLSLLIFYPVLFNITCISMHFFGSLRYSAPMILSVLYLSFQERKKFLRLLQE
jgi:hypothetical protein